MYMYEKWLKSFILIWCYLGKHKYAGNPPEAIALVILSHLPAVGVADHVVM